MEIEISSNFFKSLQPFSTPLFFQREKAKKKFEKLKEWVEWGFDSKSEEGVFQNYFELTRFFHRARNSFRRSVSWNFKIVSEIITAFSPQFFRLRRARESCHFFKIRSKKSPDFPLKIRSKKVFRRIFFWIAGSLRFGKYFLTHPFAAKNSSPLPQIGASVAIQKARYGSSRPILIFSRLSEFSARKKLKQNRPAIFRLLLRIPKICAKRVRKKRAVKSRFFFATTRRSMSEFFFGQPIARVLPTVASFKKGVRRKMKRWRRTSPHNFSARWWWAQRFKTSALRPRGK